MLDRLKEYKELIAIMIFFLSGFLWIQDLKSQVSVLGCLLEEYMTLTQLQISHQQKEREVERLSRQINAFPTAAGGDLPALSPAMKQELANLVNDREEAQGKLKRIQSDMESIRDKLQKHACGKKK